MDDSYFVFGQQLPLPPMVKIFGKHVVVYNCEGSSIQERDHKFRVVTDDYETTIYVGTLMGRKDYEAMRDQILSYIARDPQAASGFEAVLVPKRWKIRSVGDCWSAEILAYNGKSYGKFPHVVMKYFLEQYLLLCSRSSDLENPTPAPYRMFSVYSGLIVRN